MKILKISKIQKKITPTTPKKLPQQKTMEGKLGFCVEFQKSANRFSCPI